MSNMIITNLYVGSIVIRYYLVEISYFNETSITLFGALQFTRTLHIDIPLTITNSLYWRSPSNLLSRCFFKQFRHHFEVILLEQLNEAQTIPVCSSVYHCFSMDFFSSYLRIEVAL